MMERRIAAAALILCLAATAAGAADARTLSREGAAAHAVGDWPLAIDRYRAALQANPAYLEPTAGLAECFLAIEEYDEAARWAAQARKLDPSSTDIAVLEGRILVGRGDLAAARAAFTGVLAREPNHVEARFGMAEADVADGRLASALDLLSAALRLAPTSKRGLLALALLADSTGDGSRADQAIELALRSHASDPQVQLAASDHWARRSRWDLAERYARASLALAPDSAAARLALATVQIAMGAAAQAADTLRPVVAADRDNASAWYALGIAYARSGDTGRALSALAEARRAQPDDEIAGIVQENLAIDALKVEDGERAKLAASHLEAARLLESRSELDKALAEYRRALLVDPLSRDGRLGFARVERALGYPAKQLDALVALVALGTADAAVLDTVEALQGMLADTLSRRRQIDQYAMDRARWKVPVFTVAGESPLLHPLAAAHLGRAFQETLARFDSIAPAAGGVPLLVSRFDEASRAANGADWFVVVSAEESARSFSATARLYLARTAAPVAAFSAFRTGNDRVRDVFLRLAASIAAALPLRGTLVRRTIDVGIVDLGRRQGLAAGSRLAIVRRGALRLAADTPGLSWAASDAVGEILIEAVDETIAEGRVRRVGTFDYVNVGDAVVLPAPAAAPAPTAPARPPGLLQRLFGLRGG